MMRLCFLVFCGTFLFTSTALAADGDCNFDKNICQWTNDKEDQFDWVRRTGRTPSSGTGPNNDHTSGNGYYIFIEASSPRRKGDKAVLNSPKQGGDQCMRFSYNMFGNAMGSINVIITHGNLKTVLWSQEGNKGRDWLTSNVTLYGKSYVVSIEASVGGSYTSDAAIDDISFVPGSCNGESTVSVVSSSDGGNGSCSFDLGPCGWENDKLSDALDWKLSSYRPRVQPKKDHGGKVGGKYYYFDGARHKQGKHAALLSKPMCGTRCFQLFHFMSGYNAGQLNVYKVLTDHSEDPDRIVAISGNQGQTWNEHMVELNAESSQCYRLIIEGVSSGLVNQGRIAIDDLLVTDGDCCSLATKGSDAAKKVKCNFDQDFCNWQESRLGDFSWTWGNGTTPSSGTGPTADSSGRGGYAYIEASEPRFRGQKAMLVSSSLSGSWCMRFKYHMYGPDVGSLTVYRNNEIVWRRSGNHGNKWLQGYVDIDCSHMFYQMFIEAAVGSGWRGDIGIDEIEFTPEKCPVINDTKITTPDQSLVVKTQGEYCNFENSFCHWFNSAYDDFDWVRHSGDTPSAETGPSYDYDGTGQYIYMEVSGKKPTQTAKLDSKMLSGATCLKFYYLMYGKFVAELKVELWDLDTDQKRVVWSKVGEQGPDWLLGSVELNGTNYKASFVGVRGLAFQGDIALDVISTTPGNCSKSDVEVQFLDAAYKVDTGDCNFDSKDFCKWKNDDTDKFDWTVQKGRTPSGNTGPNHDHGGNGYYIFIETSSPRKLGDTARLILKALPFSTCMEFYYHMHGSNIGLLQVYRVSRDNKATAIKPGRAAPPVLFRLERSQGDKWQKAEVDIPGQLGFHQIVIEATVGDSYRGDIAIDDITFTKGSCKAKRRRH